VDVSSFSIIRALGLRIGRTHDYSGEARAMWASGARVRARKYTRQSGRCAVRSAARSSMWRGKATFSLTSRARRPSRRRS